MLAGVLIAQNSPENLKGLLQTVKDKRQSVPSRKVALLQLAKANPAELVVVCRDIIRDDFQEQKPRLQSVPKEILKNPKELTTTDIKILDDYELQKKKNEIALNSFLLKAKDNDKLRLTAVLVLLEAGGIEALPVMQETFEREFFDERIKKTEMNYPLVAAVLHGLALGKKEEMLDVIYPALFCGKEEVRTAAFDAIGDIGGPYALNPLLSCLESKRKDVRLGIIKNVGKIRLEQSLSPLIGFLMDEDEDMRKAALNILKNRDIESIIKIGKMMAAREIDPARKALLKKGLENFYKEGVK